MGKSSVLLFCLVSLFAPTCRAEELKAADSPGPVEKVVQLLEELQARIQQDEKGEQAAFNKYACWCEKTTHRKADSITTGRDSLRKLGNSILSLKGTIATRAAEIADLTSDISKNEETQQQMTAIRQKENAAFQAERTELAQAIAALEKAVIILREATAPSPKAAASLSEVGAILRKLTHAKGSMGLSPRQLALISRFASRSSFHYTPQSATVQGILKDMYDTFGGNLESITQEEARRSRNYEDLLAVKQKELATLQEVLAKREAQKAEAETMLADATQSYADTEEQLKADVAFFDITKASCEAKTNAWGLRQRLRGEELEGIGKALEILTSDEARELFGKSIKAGYGTGTFLQLGISSMTKPLTHAYKVLQTHARRAHSLRLASLAARLRTTGSGHFDEVISAIDTMIAELKQEAKSDVEQRDRCKTELHDVDLKIQDFTWKVQNDEAQITKLEQLVEAREAEKTKTIEDMQTVKTEISDMETQRVDENTKFKQSKEDDEQAIQLLEQAKEALTQYFKNNDVALNPSMLQAAAGPAPADPDHAPDATFSGKGSRKLESKGVVSLLSMIIEDLKDEIKGGVDGEAAAQLDYEKRLAAAKKVQDELNNKKINLEETIASRNEELDAVQKTLGENKQSVADQEKIQSDLKPNCDWIMEHMNERTNKRDIEIEGLRTAKQYLAGMDTPSAALAQTQRGFDDNALSQISFGAISFLQRQ